MLRQIKLKGFQGRLTPVSRPPRLIIALSIFTVGKTQPKMQANQKHVATKQTNSPNLFF